MKLSILLSSILLIGLSATAWGQQSQWIPIPSTSPQYSQVIQAIKMVYDVTRFRDCKYQDGRVSADRNSGEFVNLDYLLNSDVSLYRSGPETQPIIWVHFKSGTNPGDETVDTYITTNEAQTQIQGISFDAFQLKTENLGTIPNPNIQTVEVPWFSFACHAK